MTFILAANLSDRLLLASDTVVTRLVEGKREVVCYYPKLQQFGNPKTYQFVSCLFAGDLEFARFLSKKMGGEIDRGTLPTDIDELHGGLHDFLVRTMPKFIGRKKVTMIFAGTSYNTPIKFFDFERMASLLGPSAGQFNDATAVAAMAAASRLGGIKELNGKIPMAGQEQKIFLVEIDEERNLFSIYERKGTYNLITAGSKTLNEEEQKEMLGYFLSKRDFANEGLDIVNYMFNQFTDTIGGAVLLGTIQQDPKVPLGGMRYAGYNVERDSEKPSPKDWSFEPKDSELIIVSPSGEKIDLFKAHFDESESNGGLEL